VAFTVKACAVPAEGYVAVKPVSVAIEGDMVGDEAEVVVTAALPLEGAESPCALLARTRK